MFKRALILGVLGLSLLGCTGLRSELESSGTGDNVLIPVAEAVKQIGEGAEVTGTASGNPLLVGLGSVLALASGAVLVWYRKRKNNG